MLTLQPDDIVLIPPGIPHEIQYPNEYRETWSVKFEILDTMLHDFTNVSMVDHKDPLYRDVLLMFLKKGNGISPAQICTAEYLIASLVEILFKVTEPDEKMIVRKIREVVQEHISNGLSVRELATATGYSLSHMAVLLKNELGISPKTFIDTERLKIAKEFLLYSELNIGEISDHLGFPDLFSFSRFFKRLSGESPSAFRRANR